MSQNTKDDVIAGAFAGAIARLVSAPFDVMKIRFQLQSADNAKYTSMAQGFRSMVKEEGIYSLWKGNLSATYLWISYAMVQFGVYGILKTWGEEAPNPFLNSKERSEVKFNPNNGSHFAWKTFVLFLAGAGAGLAATAATYPFDIMRTQFALQGSTKTYSSISSFISTTMKEKGVKGIVVVDEISRKTAVLLSNTCPIGFYAGLSPALVGITPYMGLNFAIYESLKGISEKVTDHKSFKKIFGDESGTVSSIRKGICGGFAGGASKFLVYPFDTVKKRLQMQVLRSTVEGVGKVPRYSGILNCVATTVREEGVQGLYRVCA